MSRNLHTSRALIVINLVVATNLIPISQASSGQQVTLAEFLTQYLETDKGLTASRLRVEASEKAMRGKRYVAAPGLSLNLTSPYYSWGRVYDYLEQSGETYRGYYQSELRSHLLSLTLRQTLPTGGNLSVTGSASKKQSDFLSEGFPDEATIIRESGDQEFSTDIGLYLDQPLFGLWERRNDIRKASLEYETKAAQYKIDSANSLKKAVNIFFDYSVGALKLQIEENRFDRARHDAESAAKQFAEGLISEIDLLERQVAANDGQIAYYEASAAFDKAARQLRIIHPSTSADLKPQDLTEVVPLDTQAMAVTASPEVAKAGLEVEVARIGLAETKRRRYGRPSVSLWYGFQGVGDDFRQSRAEFERNRWGGSVSLGFAFPEPGLSSDIELARAALKSAESAHEEAMQAAVEDRGRLTKQVESLKASFELESRRVELLEQMVEAKRSQHRREVISLKDLVDSEMDLLSARISRLETMRKLSLAWVDLVLNSGQNPVGVLQGRQ